MDTGADAMPVPDRLRVRWRSHRAASEVEDPLASVADEVLLVRVADGDAAALATLYRRHASRLLGFLQRYARDRMLAEEILQDTLLAVWRSAHLYAGRSGVPTWLFGIAWRQAHNRLRAGRPRQVPLDSVAGWADPAPGPAEWAIANAQGAAIAEAFDALAPHHREVLALGHQPRHRRGGARAAGGGRDAQFAPQPADRLAASGHVVNQRLGRGYQLGMRSLSLWRHEVRRSGWAALLAPPIMAVIVVGAAVDGAARLGQPSRATAHLLQSLLEMALPLAAGVGAASLVGRDPAVELHLTLPTAYRTTILRRLVVTVGWVAVIALTAAAAMVAGGWWHRWPQAHSPLAGQLTWLAPTLCLSGLGLLAGALSASPAMATSLVAMLWFFDLAAGGLLQRHQWSRLLYLFATTRGTVSADWTANRLTLLAASAAMTTAGWLLLRRPSRLLTKEAE